MVGENAKCQSTGETDVWCDDLMNERQVEKTNTGVQWSFLCFRFFQFCAGEYKVSSCVQRKNLKLCNNEPRVGGGWSKDDKSSSGPL